MSDMKFESVYDVEYAPYFLYALLEQRGANESISHKKMPTMKEHVDFMASRPYKHWYIISVLNVGYVGAIYLTHQRELGIWIHQSYQRSGYARMAIAQLQQRHPGPLLANINPRNAKSISLFAALGFKQIQVTYAKE